MKRCPTWAFVLATLCVFAFASQAAGKTVLDENLDMKTMRTLAQHGMLIHLEDKNGQLKYRMVCVLVNAPLDRVWSVITNFEDYGKMVPEMMEPVIEKKSGNEVVVAFTVEVRILGPIKSTQKYKTRYVMKKPRVYMYATDDPKTDQQGYWEVVPTDGGKRTLLFYIDIAPDLMKMGTLVESLVKAKPELGLALQVSPVTILVQSLKTAAEKKR